MKGGGGLIRCKNTIKSNLWQLVRNGVYSVKIRFSFFVSDMLIKFFPTSMNVNEQKAVLNYSLTLSGENVK